jgi:hypothetical protein
MYFDRPEIFPFLFVFVGVLLGLFLLADKYINKKTNSNSISITDQGIAVQGMDVSYSDMVKLVDQYGHISVYTHAKKPIKLRKSEYPVKDLYLVVSLINERAGLSA